MARTIGAIGLAAARLAEGKTRSLLGHVEQSGRANWPGLAEALSGPGERMEEGVRGRMESLLGHDLSEARVHGGPGVDRLAAHLGAEAFTIGSRVFAPAGSLNPATERGTGLLAHELAHVVQQTAPRPLAAPGAVAVAAQPPVARPAPQLASAGEGRPLGVQRAEAEAGAAEAAARGATGSREAEGRPVDVEALAERVYQLMRRDLMLERERQAQPW